MLGREPKKNVLKGSSSKTSKTQTSQYNIVDQLKKILVQISILELLKIFPSHKEILEKALVETNVLNNLEVCKFEAMVGHLIAPHCLSFSKYDDASHSHPHNTPLHIEVHIHKHWVKRVLIDGGAGLNICTMKLVQALGFFEYIIDASKRITIKAYDHEERPSKGIIILPIHVVPIQKEIVFQVLDKYLTYNILLGCTLLP
jgi:hypothetical protein